MSDAAAGGASAPSAPSAPSTTSAPSALAATPAAPSTPVAAPVAANDNGAPPEPKHRVKVGGQEGEYTIAELTKLAEKGHGAEQRFREAAASRKEVEALLKRLPQDPISALTELVGDKSRAARTVVSHLLKDPETRAQMEELYLEHAQYEGLSPDQRKRVDEDRMMREKAAKLDQYEARAKEQRIAQQTQRYEQSFAQAFTTALTAAGVEADRDALAWMAFYTERAMANREQVDPAAFAAQIKAKLVGRQPDIKSMNAEQLESMLSEEQRVALRARDVERLKAKAPVERTPPRAPNGQFAANDNGAAKPKVIGASFFQKLRGER